MQRVLPEDCGIDPGVQVICRPSCLVTCVLEVFRDPCAAVSGLGACGEDCGYERVEASALCKIHVSGRGWMDGWIRLTVCEGRLIACLQLSVSLSDLSIMLAI